MNLSSLSKIGAVCAPPADRASKAAVSGIEFNQRMAWYRVFRDVETSQMVQILSAAHFLEFPSGHVVIKENDDCVPEAYVIVEGRVEVSIEGEVIAILSEGDLFGEYALLTGCPRTATVRAIEPTKCVVLDEDACLAIAAQSGSVNDIMLERIEENVAKGRGVFAETD